MNEDNRLLKVDILIQQKKFAEAEKILNNLLSENANNIHVLSLLAEVYFQQGKYDIASSIINNAIGLSPDTAYLFYIKSRIAIQQDSWSSAETIINQAIALDPYDADYFALLAHIKLGRKQFNEALEIANQALEIDAENLLALNVRSTALTKLDRKEESFQTIEGALREDPNNPYTHANYGWVLLEKGDHKKALEHFKESLKNNPNFEYAQSGMLEAIKATNPIYRMFLKYAFWINNLTSKYQWGFIIGFYIGFKMLKSLAKHNEGLQPYLFPLIIALALLAFSTWVITPISNLFLRFNQYGKLLLSEKEKKSSNFVAASFGVFAIGVLLYFIFWDERFLLTAAFGFAMMLPCSVMFSPSKYKNSLLYYTIAMAVIGACGVAQTFLTEEKGNGLIAIFFVGFIAFQWIANFLLISEND